MSQSTHQTVRSVAFVATFAGVALLGACSPHRTAGVSQTDNQLMLEEINLGPTLASNSDLFAYSEGPVLIAGDWLAIQCASAGGYFDNYFEFEFEDESWSPVYANVETDD